MCFGPKYYLYTVQTLINNHLQLLGDCQAEGNVDMYLLLLSTPVSVPDEQRAAAVATSNPGRKWSARTGSHWDERQGGSN